MRIILALGFLFITATAARAEEPKTPKLEFRLVPNREHDSTVVEEAEKLLEKFKPADAGKGLPAPKGYGWLPLTDSCFKENWLDRPAPEGFEVHFSGPAYHADKKHWMLTRLPTKETAVTQADLVDIGEIKEDGGSFMVVLRFTPAAGERLGELTKTKGRSMAVAIDGNIITAPTISSQVKERVAISAGYSEGAKERLEETIKALRAALKKKGAEK
jgi:preprotein translocase subunit SecD